ncbi:hypothetical protein CCHR01_04534 [Colletotrichum chrysophilum]|uniref:Uncharacterized protein n=1 Tax=Colletotrichum chrysophilum TaxID=1836956 RepID=A0AAD9ARN0_9PEZI|nr:hypothetical protein CCHR01_04534 [Colletotrichum chrysophilum]
MMSGVEARSLETDPAKGLPCRLAAAPRQAQIEASHFALERAESCPPGDIHSSFILRGKHSHADTENTAFEAPTTTANGHGGDKLSGNMDLRLAP